MGSGDLNMKKSWHPQTLANQRRVAEEKRKADEETKRAAKIQKELREERQREEMDQLNASVTHKSINKLEWMYNAPSTGIPQTSEDMEEYLLGKRDALSLLKEKDSRGSEGLTRKPEERWKEGLFAFSNRDANSERDAIAKTMEDPLADIKRREQAAIQAMLNNPLNRKRLGLDGGNTENGDSTKEKKKRRKHRRHDKESRAERGDRHRDRDRHHGQKKDRKHGGKDDGRSVSRERTHKHSNDKRDSRKEHHHRERERGRRSASPDRGRTALQRERTSISK